jgi:hypothetical protein
MDTARRAPPNGRGPALVCSMVARPTTRAGAAEPCGARNPRATGAGNRRRAQAPRRARSVRPEARPGTTLPSGEPWNASGGAAGFRRRSGAPVVRGRAEGRRAAAAERAGALLQVRRVQEMGEERAPLRAVSLPWWKRAFLGKRPEDPTAKPLRTAPNKGTFANCRSVGFRHRRREAAGSPGRSSVSSGVPLHDRAWSLSAPSCARSPAGSVAGAQNSYPGRRRVPVTPA